MKTTPEQIGLLGRWINIVLNGKLPEIELGAMTRAFIDILEDLRTLKEFETKETERIDERKAVVEYLNSLAGEYKFRQCLTDSFNAHEMENLLRKVVGKIQSGKHLNKEKR
jgi:hypothetical protein